MTNKKLNNENLSKFAKQVSIPLYDRSKINTGILHVGIGGFHRAHQAYYTNNLLQNESNKNWGICGIALLDSDAKIYEVLQKQDGLYTLIVKEFDGVLTTKIIGSIIACIFAPKNPDAVIEKMADPKIKIITLTITEGGYNFDEATGEFKINNALVQHDLKNPKNPKTIFGYLTRALQLRKEKNVDGCTIQSCDNIQGNGDVTKKMLLSYVKHAAPDLMEWIENHVSFPNSMVDRITPATEPFDIVGLKERTGIEDEWPVVCEPFRQWVIEDNFIAGRPDWETTGAQFVKKVAPYEKMKLSLLNAGHSILGILGALLGYTNIDEVIADDPIRVFLKSFMDKEVTPILPTLKGVNLETYKESVLQRFGNVYIKDQVSRICSESSAKIPKFIIPTIKKQLSNQSEINHAAFIIAAWAIYCLGLDEKGHKIETKDVMKDLLKEKATEAIKNPIAFLEITTVFGTLKTSERFVKSYIDSYNTITSFGVKKGISDNKFD